MNVAGSGGSGPCITDFPGGQVLYNFDVEVGSGTDTYPEDISGHGRNGMPPCTGPVVNTTLTQNPDQGHTCPGAMQFSIPWGPYMGFQASSAVINFSSSDWTGFKKLHAWVKVITPDLSVPQTQTLPYLDHLQFSVSSNAYGAFYSANSATSTLADREWHQLVLNLTPSVNYVPTAVVNVALQLVLRGDTPPAGPATPPLTVVLIDDIWLE